MVQNAEIETSNNLLSVIKTVSFSGFDLSMAKINLCLNRNGLYRNSVPAKISMVKFLFEHYARPVFGQIVGHL